MCAETVVGNGEKGLPMEIRLLKSPSTSCVTTDQRECMLHSKKKVGECAAICCTEQKRLQKPHEARKKHPTKCRKPVLVVGIMLQTGHL